MKFKIEYMIKNIKESDKPYGEKRITNNVFIRTFDNTVNEKELYWHRDKEDRIITPLEKTDWKIQMDNEIPIIIEDNTFIPKNTYHRVIKGTQDLKIKLIKL